MDTFEYLSVLISVVIGLGVVHVLHGIGRLISQPEAPRTFWIHSVWVLQSLVYLFYFWWFQLGYRPVQVWTSGLFIFVLSFAVALYLQCAVILPDDRQSDYEKYFFDKRLWFFGILIAVQILDGVDTHLKPPGVGLQTTTSVSATLIVRGTSIAMLIPAFFTRHKGYHGLIAFWWLLVSVGSLLARPEQG